MKGDQETLVNSNGQQQERWVTVVNTTNVGLL